MAAGAGVGGGVMPNRLLVIAVCLAVTSVLLRRVSAADLAPRGDRLAALPLELAGGWHGRNDPRLDAATEEVLNADAYLLRTYTRGGAPAGLFVAYYASQRTGATFHSPLNCLPGNGWSWTSLSREHLAADDGTPLVVNRNIASRDGTSLLIYYWYQSRGRVVASEYANKAWLLRDALGLHRSDGSLVRVVVDATRDPAAAGADGAAFVRALYRPLTTHLPE